MRPSRKQKPVRPYWGSTNPLVPYYVSCYVMGTWVSSLGQKNCGKSSCTLLFQEYEGSYLGCEETVTKNTSTTVSVSKGGHNCTLTVWFFILPLHVQRNHIRLTLASCWSFKGSSEEAVQLDIQLWARQGPEHTHCSATTHYHTCLIFGTAMGTFCLLLWFVRCGSHPVQSLPQSIMPPTHRHYNLCWYYSAWQGPWVTKSTAVCVGLKNCVFLLLLMCPIGSIYGGLRALVWFMVNWKGMWCWVPKKALWNLN